VNQLADFRAFCAELTVSQGRPLVLEAFQERMLADYFDGCRETVILIPKKCGKTTLLSAVAIWHLLATPDAACYVAAASREQASILYDAACGFVSRSPALREQLIVRRGYRELWTSDKRGKLKVLASDVDTADGVLCTLALVDELHRHRSGGLYGVLADSLGPRDGQIVTISTAGDDENSPLGQLRQRAHALPGVVRDGAYRTSRCTSGHWTLTRTSTISSSSRRRTLLVGRRSTSCVSARSHRRRCRGSGRGSRVACGRTVTTARSPILSGGRARSRAS
jgi:phage terminase large subunit-like protein